MIPGYVIIHRNDKTSNSGGIIIAVKDAMKTINHVSKARIRSRTDTMDITK